MDTTLHTQIKAWIFEHNVYETDQFGNEEHKSNNYYIKDTFPEEEFDDPEFEVNTVIVRFEIEK